MENLRSFSRNMFIYKAEKETKTKINNRQPLWHLNLKHDLVRSDFKICTSGSSRAASAVSRAADQPADDSSATLHHKYSDPRGINNKTSDALP
jgi:hypothetical protein